jgi:2-dehydropantoate 2-reductase
VIGCVVYPATELLEPGVVKLIEGDRFPVGELDGTRSERVTLIENDALMTYCLQLLPRC